MVRQQRQTPPSAHIDWPIQTHTKDGAPVVLRPMKRRDVWRAASGLGYVSRQSFHIGVEDVSIGQVANEFMVSLKLPRYLYLVTEVEDDFAGLATARPGRFGEKDFHVATLSIWLLPFARNRGVGREMMKTLIEWCRVVGYEKAELEVFANNAPAVHLYRSLGFEIEAIQRRAVRTPRGTYTHNIFMGLFLTS